MNNKHSQPDTLALPAAGLVQMAPGGFIIAAEAWWYFVRTNQLDRTIAKRLGEIRPGNPESLRRAGLQIRSVLRDAGVPEELGRAIGEAYARLSDDQGSEAIPVELRADGTAEETGLVLRGLSALLEAICNRFAAQFSDQAISDRRQSGLAQDPAHMLVSIAEMAPDRPPIPR